MCAWSGCEQAFIPTNSKHKFCPTCAIISKQTYFKRTYIPKPLKTHCKWGHEFTPENTIIRPQVSGRGCRICHSKQAQCRRFGITVEIYDFLYTFQHGICAIRNCDRPAIAIDHDHACCNGRFSCGKCVRGLICLLCNSGLGFFMDDPERLDEPQNIFGGVVKIPLVSKSEAKNYYLTSWHLGRGVKPLLDENHSNLRRSWLTLFLNRRQVFVTNTPNSNFWRKSEN